jgi:hypothetical protein
MDSMADSRLSRSSGLMVESRLVVDWRGGSRLGMAGQVKLSRGCRPLCENRSGRIVSERVAVVNVKARSSKTGQVEFRQGNIGHGLSRYGKSRILLRGLK